MISSTGGLVVRKTSEEKKNCHEETGHSRKLSKSVPYFIPLYQRKSLDEETFPEQHGLSSVKLLNIM